MALETPDDDAWMDTHVFRNGRDGVRRARLLRREGLQPPAPKKNILGKLVGFLFGSVTLSSLIVGKIVRP